MIWFTVAVLFLGCLGGFSMAQTCPTESDYQNASWEETNLGKVAIGKCNEGYVGVPHRDCDENGNWSVDVVSPCVEESLYYNWAKPINASKDAYINEDVPGPCQGIYCEEILWTGLGNEILTQYDFGGGSEFFENSCINNVIHRMCGTLHSVMGKTDFNLHVIEAYLSEDSNWNETHIGWGTRPQPISTSPINSQFVAAEECIDHYWYMLDLSEFAPVVQPLFAGGKSVTFMLKDTTALASFVSKELIALKSPWLELKGRQCPMDRTCERVHNKAVCSCSDEDKFDDGSACLDTYCNAEDYKNAHFGQGAVGDSVFGYCKPGFYNPTGTQFSRLCHPSNGFVNKGIWSSIDVPCIEIKCAPLETESSTWPESSIGNNVEGKCALGYEGDAIANCVIDEEDTTKASFTLVQSCQTMKCSNETIAGATFPIADLNTTVIGICGKEYLGSAKAVCTLNTEYNIAYFDILQECTEINCEADMEWPESPVGVVTIPCQPYHLGELSRNCLLNDTEAYFDTNITGICEAFCPALNTTPMYWPQTKKGERATAICSNGHSPAPIRNCSEANKWAVIEGSCGAAEVTKSSKVLIIAIAAAIGGILLLGLCIILFFVYRNRKFKDEKGPESNELTESRSSLTRSNSFQSLATLKLANSIPTNPYDSKDDRTLLNTVSAMVLPGFLKLDFLKDVIQEESIGSGGAGALYKGVLLNMQMEKNRTGKGHIAIKRFHNLEYGMNDEVAIQSFFQEITIMWTLKSHPNIIKLIGYTENPYSIIMEMYPTDLKSIIHKPDYAFPTKLAFLLTADIISAIAAMHGMGMIHRDIKTGNILLDERDRITAVICDFGLTRIADTSRALANSKFIAIEGMSPRYTAPEVVDRVINNPNGELPSMKLDMTTDIYSFGVVVWEMISRTFPWTQNPGVDRNEDIFRAVINGERPKPLATEILKFDPSNTTLSLLVEIVTKSISQIPQDRPLAKDIYDKLKKHAANSK